MRNIYLYRLTERAIASREALYGPLTEADLASRAPDLPDPTHAGRFFVHDMARNTQRIADHFASRSWTIVCADEEIFGTSDKPVLQIRKGQIRASIKDPETVVILPLCPRRALCMYENTVKQVNAYTKLEPTLGANINTMLSICCERYMLASKPVSELAHSIDLAELIRVRAEKRSTINVGSKC
jgi:hypothetical protein